MSKRKAVVTLIFTALVICGLGFMVLVGIGENKAGAASKIKQGLDLQGGVSITYEVVGDKNPSQTDLDDTIYKLQQRVDSYSTEAQVYQEGFDRINIEIPGEDDADAVLEELGRPGSLYFITQTNKDGESNYSYSSEINDYELIRSLEDIIADGSAILSGNDVKSAQEKTTKDENGKVEYLVELIFTDAGAKIFADATTSAYRNSQTIAIYYDGALISVPRVDEPITGGVGYISGQTSIQEARKLASNIRIGGLKLELQDLHSKVVGAQLGTEAVKTSVTAGAIGLGLVIIFMIVIYWVMGAASGLALTIYTLLMLWIINIFEITLTLPGIAGIILSIGMAVDANVIIFERVREELATGKTVRSSIDIGFKKALSAIVDGNITTLIAAIVLYLMGTGSIKGFAVTLALGILLSMFSALVITRYILKALYTLGLKSEKIFGAKKQRKTINFLSKKAICFSISGVVIAAGLIGMIVFQVTKGSAFNQGLEFSGGTSTTITMQEEYTLERVNSDIVPVVEGVIGLGEVQTQTVKGTNQVIIKTRTLNVDEREALVNKLTETFGLTEKVEQETISATISSEMRKNAIISVTIATICMLIYIWFRFKDIRFATSAIAALVHDVLVVLTFYALARISVGNTFIACMLTIVGYSINATIVIFDRIRENNVGEKKPEELKEIVNRSITQTLTRSIYTSLTTFFTVAMLFILGVSSIKMFALPLMVGIVCGAYSSVFITGALWYIMKTKVKKKKK